jgi:hypothetical protein
MHTQMKNAKSRSKHNLLADRPFSSVRTCFEEHSSIKLHKDQSGRWKDSHDETNRRFIETPRMPRTGLCCLHLTLRPCILHICTHAQCKLNVSWILPLMFALSAVQTFVKLGESDHSPTAIAGRLQCACVSQHCKRFKSYGVLRRQLPTSGRTAMSAASSKRSRRLRLP